MTELKLTVDVVAFSVRDGKLLTLLVKRRHEPFKDQWAIPGGFVEDKEDLKSAALRELEEETGLRDHYIEQLYTFGDPDRDPRGRVITVSYLALLPTAAEVKADSDAVAADWFPMNRLPSLAFDHRKILSYAHERLRNKVEYSTAGFALLPKKFSLSELQRVYEAVLNKSIDKRNFRRKVEILNILEELDEKKTDGAQRPAQLYKLSTRKFERLRDRGLLFPF